MRVRNRGWRTLRVLALVTGVLLVIVLVSLEARHKLWFGRFVSYGLDVQVLRESASIGIPGIGSMYSAELYNYTFKTIQFVGCRGPKDTSPYYEIVYRYEVQKWDALNRKWIQIMGIPAGQCPPSGAMSKRVPHVNRPSADTLSRCSRLGIYGCPRRFT